MWLLKFHAAFSILCSLTFWSFFVFFKALGIKPDGETESKSGGKNNGILANAMRLVLVQLMLLVPVMNALVPCALIMGRKDSCKE